MMYKHNSSRYEDTYTRKMIMGCNFQDMKRTECPFVGFFIKVKEYICIFLK